MLERLTQHWKEMQHNGFRRVLIIEGEPVWIEQKLHLITSHFHGDWITLSHRTGMSPQHLQQRAKSLLGQTYKHGIIDLTEHVNLDALAIMAGTLSAGSFLIITLNHWSTWETQIDHDSVRWCDHFAAIATPNFTHYAKQLIDADPDVLFLSQYNHALKGTAMGYLSPWQRPCGVTSSQVSLLTALAHAKGGHVLIAERGRGKSTLAGLFAKTVSCKITAPQRDAASTLLYVANKPEAYISPDQLLLDCQHSPPSEAWLIVDEAAAIPLPILTKLINAFPNYLFITTVLGYEGTGKGFILKFCNAQRCHQLYLSSPIRWREGDPLERLISQLLFIKPSVLTQCAPSKALITHGVTINELSQSTLTANIPLFYQFYQLLSKAHYRTTSLDLRRIMDAANLTLLSATEQENVIGAALAVNEGGLEPALAQAVWAGYRRPKGNLVAQALTAYAGEIAASTLRSLRISRLAIDDRYRRQKIGSQLIEQLIQRATAMQCDFISVSFGYTLSLYQFWLACGFVPVHVGSHQEASSGAYPIMLMRSLSADGALLQSTLENKLRRNWRYLSEIIPISLKLESADYSSIGDTVTRSDYLEIEGFAYAHRSIEASRAALIRGLSITQIPCLALRLYLNTTTTRNAIINTMNVTGKRELVTLWRSESQQLLAALKEQGAGYPVIRRYE